MRRQIRLLQPLSIPVLVQPPFLEPPHLPSCSDLPQVEAEVTAESHFEGEIFLELGKYCPYQSFRPTGIFKFWPLPSTCMGCKYKPMIRYLTELTLDALIEAAKNVPYQRVQSELFSGIDLWIRRDDLIDPLISGNKAYKLIFNMLEARERGKDTIVTYGGAWSNHVHATAAAGKRFGFKTIGIIRGQRPPVLSVMLQDAERFGMELLFVSRTAYSKRHKFDLPGLLGISSKEMWLVPEGGANIQGAKGVQILANVIKQTRPVIYDEYWLACGTGLTLAALAAELSVGAHVFGVPVLKAENAILENAQNWSRKLANRHINFRVLENGHCGGYAKMSSELCEFMESINEHRVPPFDPIYGAKVLLKLATHGDSSKRVRSNDSNRKKVLLIHSGGMQGNRGMVNY